MSSAEQAGFIEKFQAAAEALMRSYKAIKTGRSSAGKSSNTMIEGALIRSDVSMPRRFYPIGDIHGVADICCDGEAGKITVVISVIEGP
ncbi:MAG: hypothetical protein GY944_22115 [bacterium]|nr:hypothetical protein [bacterium]